MASIITGNKFDPHKDIPDLSGKTYIVTGGSAGIGFGIVAHILSHNAAKIYLVSNKTEHQDEAVEELKKYGDVSVIEPVACDFADLKQTDRVAKDLKKKIGDGQLDALVCNAGVGVGKYWKTADGLDSHMQINHLSQMHLALILLPALKQTRNSRLVFQSSDLHRMAPSDVTFSSEEFVNDIGPAMLYNRTKLAQLCFARALARRLTSDSGDFTGPFTNATHPGAVNTDQQSQAQEAYGEKLGKGADVAIGVMKKAFASPVEEGCRPALWAATSDEVVEKKVHGEYVVPDKKVTKPSSQAQDDKLGEALWETSERLLKDKLGSCADEL